MDALRQWPHTLNVKRVAYNITQATHKGKYNEHHGFKKHAHAYMLTKNGIPKKEKTLKRLKDGAHRLSLTTSNKRENTIYKLAVDPKLQNQGQ